MRKTKQRTYATAANAEKRKLAIMEQMGDKYAPATFTVVTEPYGWRFVVAMVADRKVAAYYAQLPPW